jgi:large subunit ribosomal protein L13
LIIKPEQAGNKEEKMADTFMPKAAEITRKWYLLDAEGKPLGRVATQAAHLLRGKHKPTFAPHADSGDFVIIVNIDKAILTGNKLQKKFHRWHTGWIGHLKEVRYDKLMAETPEKAFELAVFGMIPDTTIGRKARTRLHLVKGTEHKYAAQKPEQVEVRNKI